MTIRAGYLVDLRGVQFDDAASSTWIHAMGIGTYTHPIHGKITFTPERIKRFADSVTRRVRGIDPDIDYDHKAHQGDAAGWVRQAEARTDGLWLLVEWTKTAYAKLKEGAYRYFSPEFYDKWKHPETGTEFTDVLFGGGITNRPFLKDLVPINLTEITNASGGTSMDANDVLKELAKLFGLPEDTDPGVVLGHAQARMEPVGDEDESTDTSTDDSTDDTSTDSSSTDDEDEDETKKKPPMKIAASEEDIKNLPFVKALIGTVAAQSKQLDEQAVNDAVIKLDEKARTKNVAIPPATRDGLKKQLSELPPQSRAGVIQLFEGMIDNGQVGVELGEKGRGNTGGGTKTAKEAWDAAVGKKLSEPSFKGTYADAAEMVTSEQPQLYINYQTELHAV